jgi:hypothetical protein
MSHAQHGRFARLRLRRNLPALSLLLVTALTLMLVPAPRGARAAGTTWNVNPGGGGACTQADPNCATIQAAVDAASDRDTVQVAAGVYAEHVSINKDLTINGAGAAATIVDGMQSGTVFTINSGIVSLSGMTIRNGSTVGGNGGGISNFGTLNVTNSIVSGNSAISVRLFPPPPSIAGGRGGGISNSKMMNVTSSTVSGNPQ